MKTKRKEMQIICIIFILIVMTSTLASSEKTELIWEIGERDGTGNEFNGSMTGSVHYYIDTPFSNFPSDINDGYKNRTHIYIHYNLTDKQSKKDTNLSLCVVYLNENKPFKFRFSVNNIRIDDYLFTPENI